MASSIEAPVVPKAQARVCAVLRTRPWASARHVRYAGGGGTPYVRAAQLRHVNTQGAEVGLAGDRGDALSLPGAFLHAATARGPFRGQQ